LIKKKIFFFKNVVWRSKTNPKYCACSGEGVSVIIFLKKGGGGGLQSPLVILVFLIKIILKK